MKPNIFILTIDSLRADRVFGDKKTSSTPHLDSLIKNGVYFSQAISASDSTGLSIGSILTSSYSFRTGITHFSYNPDTPTFFQIFKNNGYNTYATIPDISILLKLTSNLTKRNSYVYNKRESWIQLFGGIGQQIIDDLEKGMSEPWIYYVHLMDLHSPFYLPQEFNSEKFGRSKYDRMVSYIDSWIGRFLEKIDLKNTLVVISADHGDYIPIVNDWNKGVNTPALLKKGKEKLPALEPFVLKLFIAYSWLRRKYKFYKYGRGLSDKQIVALHGRAQSHLYDDSIRIPLLFCGYGINQSKILSTQVRQIDIFPTISDIVGISSKYIVDGQSLIPLFTEGHMVERPIYIETGATNIKNTKNPTIHGKTIGIRTSQYKYWRSRNDPTKNVFLFDLQNDPYEENNIADQYPSIVNMMEKTIADIKKNTIEPHQNQFSKDEMQLIEEELKKLGYM